MEETFVARLADVEGSVRRVQLLLRECWSLLVLAMMERRRAGGAAASGVNRSKGVGWMEELMREMHHAVRRLLRTPAFTLAAAGTLALAIGANAAIFTVVYRVVLNPLPYADGNRLVALEHGLPGLNVPTGLGMTSGLYFQYVERSRTMDGVALYMTADVTLTGVGTPDRIRIADATPSLGATLGVAPLMGRWFTGEEGEPGGVPSVVLAHSFWTERFGADPSVLGRSITLSGVPYTVVGVMPPGFSFPNPRVRLWRTAVIDRAEARAGGFNYLGVARLRDGATVPDARNEINSFIPDLPNAYPNDPYAPSIVGEAGLTSTLITLKSRTVGQVAESLWILLASVGLVLLVACANVANLFLVRSEARQREIAVRQALGAGKSGIRQFFLMESLLLALFGAALGLGIAYAGVRLLVTFGPVTLPRLDEVRVDGIVVLFALGLGALSAFLFGSFPLVRRATIAPALQDTGRGNTASKGRHRARHVLMGAQMALACVLLIGAGLMVRSFQALRAIDPNFDARSAITFRIGLPAAEYETWEDMILAHTRILDELSALPGVSAVSAATCLPLDEWGFCNGDPLEVEGRTSVPGTIPPIVAFRSVAGDWFETIGTPIVRGRGIERADVQRNDAVAVINESLAERYFEGEDPIGRRVTMEGPSENERLWFTIVGVTRNTPTFSLAEVSPAPKLYMAWQSRRNVGPDPSAVVYVVRSTRPLELVPAIRNVVANVDANLALAQIRTLEDVLDRSSAQAAFTMTLIVLAAAVALVLGIIGIYGVISYIVSQRAGEIGVRLALGAEPGRVAGMIVRQGGAVALAGLLLGLLTAVALSRSVSAVLFGVSPTDPVIYAMTSVALLAIALVACWVPARRAARLSPIEALRSE
jgi:predicted permease